MKYKPIFFASKYDNCFRSTMSREQEIEGHKIFSLNLTVQLQFIVIHPPYSELELSEY